MKKKLIFAMALMMGAMTFTACSDSNNDKGGGGGGGNDDFNIVTTTPLVDEDTYPANTVAENYSKKEFGNAAIDGCADLVDELTMANSIIASSKLSEMQEAYLYQVIDNLVDNVIIPTYTKLADDVEDLEKTLNGLTISTITQDSNVHQTG